MIWSVTVWRTLLVTWAAVLLTGCVPSGQSQADEEKEPHFMAGKKRVSTMDYGGAIESFEKALEVNPRSGAAHFELACLFTDQEPDPAAAIYHYQSYLKLRPEAGNAELVRQRIQVCRQELARNVSLGPLTDRQQRELEQVLEDNKKLTLQVNDLKQQLQNWQVYAARLAGTNRTTAPVASGPGGSAGNAPPPPASGSTALRTHSVKAGETLTTIAKQYGIKVSVLLSANPRVDARRLKVGQALTIPTP